MGAAERNKGPLLERLREVLPSEARVLELASGFGQHAAWFAHHEPGWWWQPTELDPTRLQAIDSWHRALDAPNLQAPIRLDVTVARWPVEQVDAVVCTNMVHVAPWSATLAVLDGAAKVLVPGGVLVFYGPWRLHGEHTSEGNVRFDETLRARDATWGIRDLDDLEAALAERPLTLEAVRPVPANNRVLVLRR